MALFFDQAWFDGRLTALGLTRAHIAQALGLTAEQVAEIWKDQREVHVREVAILAGLLGVGANEIAARAGVSTPVPTEESTLEGLTRRVSQLEAELAALKARLG